MHASVFRLAWPLLQYGQGMGQGGGPGYGSNGSWHMMSPLGSGLLSVLGLVALVALLAWLLGHSGGRSSRREDTPLDILKKRYARGEIDRETFERMKHDLDG